MTQQEDGENSVMRSFIFCTLRPNIIKGDQIKENEKDGADKTDGKHKGRIHSSRR
jgi:hypothetical protein